MTVPSEKQIRRKLDQIEPRFYESLDITDEFLGHLVSADVLRHQDRDGYTLKDNVARIGHLFTHIRRNPIDRYNGFKLALMAAERQDIITNILKEPLPVLHETSNEPAGASRPMEPCTGAVAQSMAVGAGIQLWKLEGAAAIDKVKVLASLLTDNIPDLQNLITFSPKLLGYLVKYKAVSKETRDEIEVLATTAQKGQALFKQIKFVRELRGLLMALAEDEQEEVIINLGFDPNEYKIGSPAYVAARQKHPQAVELISQPSAGSSTPRMPPTRKEKENPSAMKADDVHGKESIVTGETPDRQPPFQSAPVEPPQVPIAQFPKAQGEVQPAPYVEGGVFTGDPTTIRQMEIPDSVESLQTRNEITIAVLDTGIRKDHPDFNGVIGGGADYTGYGSDLFVDIHGHGTHVAGIIHQYTQHIRLRDGRTPSVKIWNFKVMHPGRHQALKDALKVIKDRNDHGTQKVDIINMSLSCRRDEEVVQLLNDLSKNTIIVCAAGNSGQAGKDTVRFPANHGQVLSIGSYQQGHTPASYSAAGQNLDFIYPGTDVVSYYSRWEAPGSEYFICSGTSMAAPHCSAMIAWILAIADAKLHDTREKLTNCHQMKDILKYMCNQRHDALHGFGTPHPNQINLGNILKYLSSKGIDWEDPMP